MFKFRLFFFLVALTFSFATEIDALAAEDSVTPQSQENLGEVTPKDDMRRHNLSLELLGRGLLYSFNYDYMLTDDLALGAGFSRTSISAGRSDASAWILPVYANYYFTPGKHRVFATGGANFVVASGTIDGSESKVTGSGLAGVVGGGYEFRADNGFLFRAAPYLFVGKASGVWAGLSLGYSF
jgi:hypothetical protein